MNCCPTPVIPEYKLKLTDIARISDKCALPKEVGKTYNPSDR